jgi:hypothetical protein
MAQKERHQTRKRESAPHTPQQDGVSERSIRTVTEGARSYLYDSHDPDEPFKPSEKISNNTESLIKHSYLPIHLWAEAASCVVYTRNRVLCKASTVTPFER